MSIESNPAEPVTIEYRVQITARTREECDKVLWARIGHDEDLSAVGVGDYQIDSDGHGKVLSDS